MSLQILLLRQRYKENPYFFDAYEDQYAGWGHFELSFLRMRDKKETDFLILRDNKPWMLIEAKQSSTNVDSHHFLHASRLFGFVD